MPGQPLSSVTKKPGSIFVGSHSARRNPLLVTKVAEAFAIASEIEAQFSGLLIAMIGAKEAGHAVTMLHALTSTTAQSAAIGAVAAKMPPPWNTIYEAVAQKCYVSLRDRNRFAHWAWASCKTLPDTLLFIEPATLIEHDIATGHMMHPPDGRGLSTTEIDHKRVMVYRESDLNRALKSLRAARDAISLLRFARYFPWLPDEQNEALPQLLAVPEVHAAFARAGHPQASREEPA